MLIGKAPISRQMAFLGTIKKNTTLYWNILAEFPRKVILEKRREHSKVWKNFKIQSKSAILSKRHYSIAAMPAAHYAKPTQSGLIATHWRCTTLEWEVCWFRHIATSSPASFTELPSFVPLPLQALGWDALFHLGFSNFGSRKLGWNGAIPFLHPRHTDLLSNGSVQFIVHQVYYCNFRFS